MEDARQSTATFTPRSPDSLAPRSIRSSPRVLGPPHRRLQLHRSQSSQQLNSEALLPNATSRLIEVSGIDALDAECSENDSSNAGRSFMSGTSDESSVFEDAPSPSNLTSNAPFLSAVATPPIADNDIEPFEHINRALSDAMPTRPTINTDVQNASLPSPSLSPTFAAAKLHDAQAGIIDFDANHGEDSALELTRGNSQPLNAGISRGSRDFLDAQGIVSVFDGMADDLKSFMLLQLLRRCNRQVLHQVANIVNPSLQLDFLDALPGELSLHILSFLNHTDLCRASQVSKRWRNIIDSNEAGWKDLLERDGYKLPEGELDRAITQGWGWQDPVGSDGYERDLTPRPVSSGTESGGPSQSEVSTSTRSKRKRAITSLGRESGKRHKELLKRLADGSQPLSTTKLARTLKSEGPQGASTAAVIAVPNPGEGLPTLQKMHLFKSLYRRRHMIHNSWMNPNMKPHHMAFPAHPRHVITCLQFDDDKIITGSDDTYIHIYDTKTGRLRKRLEGHEGGVWALEYEGNILVSGSTDRSVRVWNIEKGICTQVFQGHTSTVRCLQIVMPVATGKIINGKAQMLPEKPLIITGSRDSHLRIWRLPENSSKKYNESSLPQSDIDCPYFVQTLTGHAHSVRAIAAHGDVLISGSYDNSVRVWKISTGETVKILRGHQQKVYSVVLDVKRNRCISGSMDTSVKIWDLDTGDCLFTLDGHTNLVGLLDLQDGRLVSAAADSTLRIWSPATGQCKSTLTAHTGAITCFQHDGTKVISGSDRTLKMWNVKTGECLEDLLSDLTGVWQVKFDDRRCVAAVQRDGATWVEVCGSQRTCLRTLMILQVLDFGAARDGIPASERGRRHEIEASDVDRAVLDEDEQL